MNAADVASLLSMSVVELRAAACAPKEYVVSYRRKSRGGRRKISAPDEDLKGLQQKILRAFLGRLVRPADLRHVLMTDQTANAKAHMGQAYIISVDLKDAFPSMSVARVRAALRTTGLTADAARQVCDICMFRDELPQGAPTSNALLDLVLLPVDRAIDRQCRREGARYTRYVDNLYFSGPVLPARVESVLRAELASRGLALNEAKTERGGGRNAVDVTGIATADRLLVRESTLGRVRESLRAASVNPHDLSELPRLKGKIAWVRRVNSKQAAAIVARHVPAGTPLREALRTPRRKK